MTTADPALTPSPPPSDLRADETVPDPLLAHRAFAIACDAGLSSCRWSIAAAGAEVLTAARDRDPRRSWMVASLMICTLMFALPGAYFSGLVPLIGRSAAIAIFLLMCAGIIGAIIIAPSVALQRLKPIVLRDAAAGDAPLLTIHRRTRFPIASVAYDVLTPEGNALGEITQSPLIQVLQTSWHIRPHAGSIITLTEPSLSAAIRARLPYSKLLSRRKQAFDAQTAPPIAYHAVVDDSPDPLAKADRITSPGWTWVVFHPDCGPSDRYLILAAFLLLTAELHS